MNLPCSTREPAAPANDPSPRRIAVTPDLVVSRAVAILRSQTVEHIGPVVETVAEAGLTCVELTFTIPGLPALLKELTTRLGPGVTIGAGTVTTARQAREAIDAGAVFLASPMLCPDVLQYATDQQVPCFPGAWTPTEVATAWNAGASAVKLFPAATGGVGHLRSLREVFREIPFLPTGGVDAATAAAYVQAGAIGVGVGGRLIGDALQGGDLAALAARAGQLKRALHPG